MEQPTIVPRRDVRKYEQPDWDNKFGLIRRLFVDKDRHVDEIVKILAEQHDFHVE
jgi:hypothetical protein